MANRCLVDSNDYRRITRLTWTITPFGREQLPKFFQRFNLDDDCQLTDLLYGWTCRTAFTVQLQRWTVDDLTGSTLARLPGTTRHIHCDTITRYELTQFTVTRLPDSAWHTSLWHDYQTQLSNSDFDANDLKRQQQWGSRWEQLTMMETTTIKRLRLVTTRTVLTRRRYVSINLEQPCRSFRLRWFLYELDDSIQTMWLWIKLHSST